MNKTAIKNFAIWARNKLIADICYRAGLMGITENPCLSVSSASGKYQIRYCGCTAAEYAGS